MRSATLRELRDGLREQREQLREQIARAVAQFADHQLVALIRLAALDRAGDQVGDRDEERHVVLAEAAPPRGVRAEHAIGAPVAPGDRHAHAAVDAVVAQQRRDLEARLGFEIGDDHRPAGRQRVARLRMAAGRFVRGADSARAPAEAGAQQELGVARHQFEDLHELDVENLGDRRDDLVEQRLQIGFGERALAEPRHDLLLLGADAQFAQQLLPVGHVAADAEEPHDRAVLLDHRRDRLDPAVLLPVRGASR